MRTNFIFLLLYIVKQIAFFRSPSLDLQHRPGCQCLNCSAELNCRLDRGKLEVPWTWHQPPLPTPASHIHMGCRSLLPLQLIPGAPSPLWIWWSHRVRSSIWWAEWHRAGSSRPRGRGTEPLPTNTVYLGQPEHIPGPGCSQEDTKQSSFAFGVAMTARNLQTKPDLEINSVLGPKS